MLNSTVIDVVIGLVFVYLALGLMCTTVCEWIAQGFKTRPNTLRQGIHVLLGGPLSRLTPVSDEKLQIMGGNINFPRLIDRIFTPNDKLAQVLGLVSEELPGREEFAFLSPQQKTAFAAKIDSLLDDPNLYTKIDVSKVAADTLAKAKKAGAKPRPVNFNLLSEAYPEEIGGLLHAFYAHPLIKSLSKPGAHPSYISSTAFSTVLMDILKADPQVNLTLDVVVQGIDNLPDSDEKRSLLALVHTSGKDLQGFQKSLETWFNDSMDRVSGWYKAKMQIVTVCIAAGLTIFANADTVQIARNLFVSPTLRATLVADATEAGKNNQASDLTEKERVELGELTGWSADFRTFNCLAARAQCDSNTANDAFPGFELVHDIPRFFTWAGWIVPPHLLGWLLTAIAVSFGAPFWFDMLKNVMNIRATGVVPDRKKRDDGQDRSS